MRRSRFGAGYSPELRLGIAPEIFARLKKEADRRKIRLAAVARERISDSLAQEDLVQELKSELRKMRDEKRGS